MIALAAALLAATPTTLPATIASAKAGDTIRVTGTVPLLAIKKRTYAPPLTIQGGIYGAIVLDTVDGLVLSEVTVTGNGLPDTKGIQIDRSAHVTIAEARVSRTHRGIVIGTTTDFAVTSSYVFDVLSDGLDIALSRRGLVLDNTFDRFTPKPATYDAAGKLLVDGDHPDGIQLWSRPEVAPTADIVIRGNVIVGNVQCIFGGNHVRPNKAGAMTGDGGFDRITVTGNTCRGASGRGISLSDARGSVIRDNDAQALANARSLATNAAIKVNVLFDGASTGSVACGNRVPDVKNSPAATACKEDAR